MNNRGPSSINSIAGHRIIGIDEAGLGPILGPLCVSMISFTIPADAAAPIPPELMETFGRSRRRSPSAFLVRDSKTVFGTPAGHAAGELSVLTWLLQQHPRDEPLPAPLELIEELHPRCGRLLAAHPWYGESLSPLPLWADEAAVRTSAGWLERTLRDARLSWRRPRARVLPEGALNASLRASGNKATSLWELVAQLLCEELADGPPARFLIAVDRLGGRRYYAPLLERALAGWQVQVEREERSISAYHLVSADGSCSGSITFQTRAEEVHFAVAMASLLAKYLRETLMHAFNSWFAARAPAVPATAGYAVDGRRWLAAMQPYFSEIGILPEDLLRLR